MEIQLLELVLWAGLAFFFWALKDNLGKVESDLEGGKSRHRVRHGAGPSPFSEAERLVEPIGSYLDRPIHRVAVVGGRHYCFESICPIPPRDLASDVVCLRPGLLYRACSRPFGTDGSTGSFHG